MFKKVEELLESESITKEVAEALDSEIGTALSALRDESKGFREERDTLLKSFEEVTKHKEELDSKLNNYDEKIKAAKDEGKSELTKQLEDERLAHTKLIDTLSSVEQENSRLKVSNAVSEQLAKYNIKKDLVGDAKTVLQGFIVAGEDGLKFGDGKSVEEGIKEYFDSRTSFLEPQGEPGSGAGGNGGSGHSNKMDMTGSKESRLQSIENMLKG